MSHATGPESNIQMPPVLAYHSALREAAQGIMPPYDTPTFLDAMNLQSDRPDGRTIVDRLVGDDHDFKYMRAMTEVTSGSYDLIELTNRREANPAQEAVAASMGAAISRQLVREGDICPGAEAMASMSSREDIITPEAKRVLGGRGATVGFFGIEVVMVDPKDLPGILSHGGLPSEREMEQILDVFDRFFGQTPQQPEAQQRPRPSFRRWSLRRDK